MEQSRTNRRAIGVGGGAVLVSLAAVPGREGIPTWLIIGAILLIVVGVALLVRARMTRTQGRPADAEELSAGPRQLPLDSSAPDGEVGTLAIDGIVADPPIEGLKFRRFVALEPKGGELPFRSFRIWGRRYPPLLGRVAIVSVFIGRDGRAWSNDELVAAHRALHRAGAWIEREAIRWQVAMNLDLAEGYFTHVEEDLDNEVAIFRPDEWGSTCLPDPDAESRILGILGRAAGKLGFKDPVDLLGRIGRRIEADQVVWLLHIRRAGKSIALPSDVTGIPGVAVATCFAQEEDFEAPMARPAFPDPITFVHELMHLFGATDKYDQSLSSFPKGTVSERDIMVLGIESLSRLRVDPLTAVEIGWASSPSERPIGPDRPLRSKSEERSPKAGKKKRPRRP